MGALVTIIVSLIVLILISFSILIVCLYNQYKDN
ncbi:hypothetical protein ACUXQE_000864 [Staphylococcus saprophyticus]|uniref:Uncharacterized protein n=1 Tax=Staphylococcus saprophyticus TaxID=29385 RepID=A0A380HRI8_STASA|nr:Uncharacterised protein [Streptococcus equi subsp. equi]SUM65040.1 Uncharacterised protein [Staphylococcus saprophyticus]SUM65636.1 Uncharacterised protein [Staphylococcus saprophyticus]SUM75724.1 Uncharacterised protein [Staphylococcus saprophyticus]SUM78241.1 Uncharacterised protein [Staphylococcus saprophyticus]